MKLKNEVIVGIVVIAGLVLLAVGGYWLTGRPWTGEQRELVAAFDEVGLLTEGSQVKYRGVPVGRVERIRLSPRGIGVFVTMSVDPEVELPPDAGVVLAPESFFGDWIASIVSRNQEEYRELDFTVVPGRNVIPGAALPDITELTAVAARIADDLETLSDRVSLAFTEETAVQIRETVENVAAVSEQLEGFIDQQTDTYAQVSQNVLATTAEIRSVTGQLGAAVDRGEIEATIRNARLATENLQRFSAQLEAAGQGVPGLVTQADATLGNVNALVEGLGPQLEQVGPTLQQAQEALATLQRAAARIEEGEGTLGRLLEDPALFEETQRAIATLNRLLADVQANPGKYIGKVKIF